MEDISLLFEPQSQLEFNLGLIVVAHAFTPGILEAESGGSLCVPGQSDLICIASSSQGRVTSPLKRKRSKPRRLFIG